MASPNAAGNFEFLAAHDPLFLELGRAAERAFNPDPATTVIKLRQLGEAFAKHAAAATGVFDEGRSQHELLSALQRRDIVEGRVRELFHLLRSRGNDAVHGFRASHREAMELLRVARQLAIWFHKTFGGAPNFKPGPFVPPPDPDAGLRKAEAEVARLKAALAEQEELNRAREAAQAEAEARRQATESERADWEALAVAMEAEHAARLEALEQKLAGEQAARKAKDETASVEQEVKAASQAAEASLDLSEEETRVLIDAQLRAVGWEADSPGLRYASGARPEKGKNRAIAEWPTHSGPADYVLFAGLTPVGVVEAKKKQKNVSGALTQAKRYAETYRFEPPQTLALGARSWLSATEGHSISKDADPSQLDGAFGWYAREAKGKPVGYRVPFLYATNGREFHRQYETHSGIWFLDARRPTNHAEPLMAWHSPEGLLARLEKDDAEAEAKLKKEPFGYTGLRPYQVEAVQAVEGAIAHGQRSILLAMATGTGKTRTVIALIYRLLKSGRARRVLFLVDRTALGEQAENAMKGMKLEQDQVFTNTFEVKSLTEPFPEASTKVHLATVQAMVKRVLEPKPDGEPTLGVDAYDLVIVDESHRGYNLDREMTEGEQELRGLSEYVSMYRRVLDYFDAIKVGLTATPALHTKEIFGKPVYEYSYREAVIDNFLVDHEPPISFETQLNKGGIHFVKGEKVKYIKPDGVTDTSELPDDASYEVSSFNRKVVSKEFSRVVCEAVAEYVDPSAPGKTLVFCVDDSHADDVVIALKKALKDQWGEIEDNAVLKITGATDKYLQQIRNYKNEKQPSIAVTVDLLTTGIDVPAIVNLVFIRRVRSRILYEQMIGRATRKCDDIGKEVFRIYDAVGIYDALEEVSQMKPVVTQVNVGLDQLLDELDDDDAHLTHGREEGKPHADDVLDQIVVKVQRMLLRAKKQKKLSPEAAEAKHALELLLGGDLSKLPETLKKLDAEQARAFFNEKPKLGERLLQFGAALGGEGREKIVSEHADALVGVTHGFGKNQAPEDYIESFGQLIREKQNEIAALKVVCTRPRDLTRQQLRELQMILAASDYTEAKLQAAWSQMRNEDIAAKIIGFIRQQALGAPLLPYAERVKRAKTKILKMHPWTPGQRGWLERIAAQLEKEVIVDEASFATAMFKKKGGYKGIDKQLGGRLAEVLGAFGDAIWDDEAA